MPKSKNGPLTLAKRAITTDPLFLVKAILLFIVYFFSAKAGLTLDPVGGFATLVWPPTGIALAALLLFGVRLWPAIALAALFVNFSQGAPWYVALGISFGNTMEALFAVYLLRTFVDFRNSLESLRDILGLIIFGAILSTIVSASIGTLSLYLGNVINDGAIIKTWTAWWIGDMLGNLIIAPFILLFASAINTKINIKRAFEFIILFSILGIVTFVAFRGFLGINTDGLPVSYLVYLPLIFISLRFGPRETSLALLILSTVATWGTASGYGIFARERLSESLFFLQSFIGTTAIIFLTLSSLMQEKRMFDERKDEFLAIASHELKTPVTTIKAYTELIKRRLPKKYKGLELYFSRVDDEIQRLTKLVNDMLDINRISVGKLDLGLETFRIDEFAHKVTRDIQKITKKNKIVLKMKTKDTVSADKYKVTQVLTNLISNAAKFSPDSKKIDIQLLSNKRFVTIAVKDLGRGIDKRHLRNVFKRFFQASKEPREGKVGLGLGLYISHEIIRKHGGKMWVKSTLGKGSTFYFTLPKANERSINPKE